MFFTTHLLCAPDPQTVVNYFFLNPDSVRVVTDHMGNSHHSSALCPRCLHLVSFFVLFFCKTWLTWRHAGVKSTLLLKSSDGCSHSKWWLSRDCYVWPAEDVLFIREEGRLNMPAQKGALKAQRPCCGTTLFQTVGQVLSVLQLNSWTFFK